MSVSNTKEQFHKKYIEWNMLTEMFKIKHGWNISNIGLVLKVLTPEDLLYKLFHIRDFGSRHMNRVIYKENKSGGFWEAERGREWMHWTKLGCWTGMSRTQRHLQLQHWSSVRVHKSEKKMVPYMHPFPFFPRIPMHPFPDKGRILELTQGRIQHGVM